MFFCISILKFVNKTFVYHYSFLIVYPSWEAPLANQFETNWDAIVNLETNTTSLDVIIRETE